MSESKMTPEMVERVKELLYEMGRKIALWGEIGVETKAHGEALSTLLSEWEERGKFVESLKTGQGRDAFALSIGYPLPEEMASARRIVEESERSLAEAQEEIAILESAGDFSRGVIDSQRRSLAEARAEIDGMRVQSNTCKAEWDRSRAAHGVTIRERDEAREKLARLQESPKDASIRINMERDALTTTKGEE